MARGTLYLYFPTKEALSVGVLTRLLAACRGVVMERMLAIARRL
jgi:AcrR family transcriptional regulator